MVVIFIALSHSACHVETAVSHLVDYVISAGFQPERPTSNLQFPQLAFSYVCFLHFTLSSWSPFDSGEGY